MNEHIDILGLRGQSTEYWAGREAGLVRRLHVFSLFSNDEHSDLRSYNIHRLMVEITLSSGSLELSLVLSTVMDILL